jgi:hypothetical protein
MPLYIERSNALLAVATDCTVYINARNNSKFTDLGKRRATELLLNAAQKFLFEVTRLSAGNVDHGVCVKKLHAMEWCKYL